MYPWHYQLLDRKGQALAFLVLGKNKVLSVIQNVNKRASTPLDSTSHHTEETDKCQAFNNELLAFPKAETQVSPPERGWKMVEKNGENHRDKQSITFSKSPSLNEAVITQHCLTQIKGRCWIWINLSVYLPPSLTHIKVLILLFSSSWLNLSQWPSPCHGGRKSQGFFPKDMWMLRGGEQVHLFMCTSICSTDSSFPSTLPSTPACSYDWLTGFYIIHYNKVPINKLTDTKAPEIPMLTPINDFSCSLKLCIC